MKKQLCIITLLVSIFSAHAETIKEVQYTGHYRNLPATMSVGHQYSLDRAGYWHPYQSWDLTVKNGDAVKIVKSLDGKKFTIHALKKGKATVTLTGTVGKIVKSADKTITVQ